MSRREYLSWIAFNSIEPGYPVREEYWVGHLTRVIMSIMSKHPPRGDIEKFTVFHLDPKKSAPSAPIRTMEERNARNKKIEQALNAWAGVMNKRYPSSKPENKR